MRDSRRSRSGETFTHRVGKIRAGPTAAGLVMFAAGMALMITIMPTVFERGAALLNGDSATATVTEDRVTSVASGPDAVKRDVRQVLLTYSVDARTWEVWISDDSLRIGDHVTVHYAVDAPVAAHVDSPGGRFAGSLIPVVIPLPLLVWGTRLVVRELKHGTTGGP